MHAPVFCCCLFSAVYKGIRKLDTNFRTLETLTFDTLREKQVSVGLLKEFLASLFLESELEHRMLFDRIGSTMVKSSAVEDIWDQLSDYWDTFNPSLLGHVIIKFGDEKLKSSLKDYEKLLQSSQATTQVSDLSNVSYKRSIPEKNWKRFSFKLHECWDDHNLENLEVLAVEIAQKFRFPPFVMVLQEVAGQDHFCVTWTIPAIIGASLKENIENMDRSDVRSFCKEHGIESITIAGEECKYSAAKIYSTYLKELYSHKEGKNLAPFKLARIEQKCVPDGSSSAKRTLVENQEAGIRKYIDENEIGNTKEPRLVLIEGAPGVGKTTFSEQFCYKWSQGKLLGKHKMLVLLPLRDNRVRSARNVSDLFQHHELQQAIAEEVESSEGEGVALWLEAWDELGGESRNKSSIFLDLVHRRVLPKATIFITSRSWATKNIMELVNQHIEILSTPNLQFSRILRENRIAPDIRSKFIDHVNSTPIMKAAMRTPATANIVSLVFQWCMDFNYPPPTTMTQLYMAFTRSLLTRHISTEEAGIEKHLQHRSLEDGLPASVKEQFLSICAMAWNGILEQRLIFVTSDIADRDTLGLMHGVGELYEGEGSQPSYNFIHLALQEFLSAYHITQRPPDEQKRIIQEHICMEHLDMVFRFYFGLTKITSQTNSEPISEDLETTAHHWLYEASKVGRYAREMQSQYAIRVMSLNSWNALDYYVLGHCIARYQIQWNLDIHSTLTGDAVMEMLSKGMASIEEASWKGEIEGCFAHCSITVDGIGWFLNTPLSILQHIKNLDFSMNKLDGIALDTLAVIIPELTQLEVLSLNGNPIGDGGAVKLMKSLHENYSPLKELNLSDSKIGCDDCVQLAFIMENLELEELRISSNCLPATCTSSIMSGLLQNSTLQTLHMSDSVLSEKDCMSLASFLQQSECQLMVLDISRCSMSDDGVLHLTRALSNNCSIRRLDVSSNPIGDIGAAAFGDVIARNSVLVELVMNRCDVTSEGCIQLAAGLTGNSSLKELMIGDNSCGVEGAKVLSKALERNKTLKVLYLRNDVSLEEGTDILLSSLSKNVTLSQLHLSVKYKRPADPRIQWN